MLDGMGIATGVSLDAICDATRYIAGVIGRDVASRTYNAREAAAARVPA
jgi:hypothetical protein